MNLPQSENLFQKKKKDGKNAKNALVNYNSIFTSVEVLFL